MLGRVESGQLLCLDTEEWSAAGMKGRGYIQTLKAAANHSGYAW